MNRETRILQERIEILPLDRRRQDPRERVRREQDEEQEGRRDPRLDTKHERAEVDRHAA